MSRINEQVTGHEVEFAEDAILASKTDLGGRITFANQVFIDISGFSLRELIGAPHNILRHPHMPKQAFADLWATIKQGKPWEGLVKNRCKNGDHYWVRANVTPVFEGGKHVGYISLRSKPSRAEIAAAEQLYAAIREGRLTGYTLTEGRLERTGLAGRVLRFRRSIVNQVIVLQVLMVVGALAAAGSALAGAPVIAAAVLGVGTIVGILLGWPVISTVLTSLRRLEGYLNAMIGGKFAFDIEQQDTPEFIKADTRLRELRAKLGYHMIEKEETARRANEILTGEMTAMAEALDDEARDTVGQVAEQARLMTASAVELASIADRLRTEAREVANAVETTSGNVETVAGATEELEASSREISQQISGTLRLAETAREKADAASRRVAGLTEATAQIGNVVTLIQDIAGQTRLLALNATIEAERAGAAGKGFAVVASEVKELAQQTDTGIDTVSSQAEAIGKTTRETTETVQAVAATIRDIDARSAEVARAADQQRAATAEIMRSAATAAEHTRSAATSMRTMLEQADATGETAKRVDRLSGMVGNHISTLQRRLYVILHSSRGGDRRGTRRVPVAIRFRASFANQSFEGFTGDISAGGALLVASQTVSAKQVSGTIELEGIGQIAATLIDGGAAGMHAKFADLDPAVATKLEKCIDQLATDDKPYLDLVESVAAGAAAALVKAIGDGAISRENLFDIAYTPIPNTDPEQVMAKHTTLVERLFPPLIEPPLARDTKIVFCCIADRNGYIAAHNTKYSQPQRPGDRQWNMANARNRRVFDDPAGIMAARCSHTQVQTYPRQMDATNVILLREFDAPIKIDGRRWGAVRLALKLS